MPNSTRKLSPPLRLGILGGGQLAQMLCLSAYEMGIRPFVLCQAEDEPAALVTRDTVIGDPSQSKDLEAFFSKVDVVTFESEFYDGNLIEKISQETQVGVFPSPSAMLVVQDRLTQKELIQRHLKTAAFVQIDDINSTSKYTQNFAQGFVLKQRMGGYDGNGTHVIRNQMDLIRTIEALKTSKHKFIAEEFIPFERELAIMVARNSQGQLVNFPLVESKQSQNRCDSILGPVHHPKFAEILKGIEALLHELQYVGVMGVEMFESKGEILVNELAPRVHNSGHYTQNCADVDQFKMHLLAILGAHLQSPQIFSPHFAMKNLIGTSAKAAVMQDELKGTLHWYGKSQNRSGRKMGHLNYSGLSQEVIQQYIESDLTKIKL